MVQDGIIQKVLNKYYGYILYSNDLEKIGKELIAEIKKEFELSYKFTNDITMVRTLRIKLIGDNE